MNTSCWQIIRDDVKMTFEVYGQTTNSNHFTNSVHAMQKAGMNVSCMTPPVSNKHSSKGTIKITGYTQEDGLHERLLKQHRDITMRSMDRL